MKYQFEWSKIETCLDCPLLDWEETAFMRIERAFGEMKQSIEEREAEGGTT